MRTRQSTANITHHDATHTFFIYMTTKTALNVQRQKQNSVTHWKYSLSWLPAFISCSSPLLDIVLEFSVSSSNFFLKYLYTKFNKSIVASFFFYPVYFPLLLLEMVWIMHTCFDQVRSAIASESTDSYCLH